MYRFMQSPLFNSVCETIFRISFHIKILSLQAQKCVSEWRGSVKSEPQGFTSLCRQAQLHSKGAAFSSHLHQTPKALFVKPDEVFSLRDIP
ncbi:MAG: hypothetical protein J6S58_04945 [Lentisphaeria bacterium]|nr:hypothetical protein [Lentisphaeria bacterium]